MEKNSFKQLCEQDKQMSKTIHEELVNVLEKKNFLIDLRNFENKHDSIYGIVYDQDKEEYRETKILALGLFDGEVCILPSIFADCDDEDVTAADMWEDENWVSIYGGLVWINATLVSIAESIEQYI